MDISLITSLYRSDEFIQSYGEHVLKVAAEIKTAGLSLEIIIVANNATPIERQYIDNLALHKNLLTVKPLYVERETLYASWNRGVKEASGKTIGFWNVDDVRTADGILDGYRLIIEDNNIAYFPYDEIRNSKLIGISPTTKITRHHAHPFNRDDFTRHMLAGPFFMFTHDIYDKVGPFDDRFRIVGDFDWCLRAAQTIEFTPSEINGGYFYRHEAALSGDMATWLEDNITLLKNGIYDYFRPADPLLLQRTWSEWEKYPDIEAGVPPEVADQLWGENAIISFSKWQRKQKLLGYLDFIRSPIRYQIDKLRLRRLLSKWGLVLDPKHMNDS